MDDGQNGKGWKKNGNMDDGQKGRGGWTEYGWWIEIKRKMNGNMDDGQHRRGG